VTPRTALVIADPVLRERLSSLGNRELFRTCTHLGPGDGENAVAPASHMTLRMLAERIEQLTGQINELNLGPMPSTCEWGVAWTGNDALEHAELDMVPHHVVHPFQERHRRVPQRQGGRRPRSQLPQPHADPHPAVGVTGQETVRDQLCHQPRRGRQVQSRTPGDLGDGESRVVGREHLEDPHGS
jgi:hypothetical protein